MRVAALSVAFLTTMFFTEGPVGKLCELSEPVTSLNEIPEASGVAVSTANPGMLWINSDNHDPVLYQVDFKGSPQGHVNVTGATARNWEDVSVGHCSRGSCLFIADIGDNRAKRGSITVYRVPEPARGDTATESVQAFRGIYPEGAEDAEAMWVTPEERVYLVTKGETGPVEVYRFPVTARSGVAVELEKVVELDSGVVKKRERITDADMSP